MNDTVKLIVTLSKGQYETLKNIQCGSIGSRMIVNAVMNGIPLDDVKEPKNGERFSCPNCGFKADWFIPSKENNTKESK